MRQQPIDPTSTEFYALKLVWLQKSATSEEIVAALAKEQLTPPVSPDHFIQSMIARGLIFPVSGTSPQAFATTLDQEETCLRLLRKSADKVFGGSMRALVQHFVDRDTSSPKHIEKAKRLLDLLDE